MKQKLFCLFLFLFCLVCATVKAQFYNSFNTSGYFENESAAIELNNGFLFGFTEMASNQSNYHTNILLIKTNTSGDIIWSKRYDAGIGKSIHLVEMICSADNGILISGFYRPDNKYGKNTRLLLRLKANGNLIWARKYSNECYYDSRGLAELKDSTVVFSLTKDHIPAVVQINSDGKILSSMQVSNRPFQSIFSITPSGNKAQVVAGDSNVITINFKTGTISHQQQYKTSGQFSALVSSVCKNGDLIYLAGRNYGGLISGNSRVFRTKPNGDLIWAKNIDAFKDNSNSNFSRFDIISQVSVHEDIHGNIVAVVEEEFPKNLMVVLDAKGKYLYNRFFDAPYTLINETTSGSYLTSAPPYNVSSGSGFISNRNLSDLKPCDSSIFVYVTNGTDSSSALNDPGLTDVKISSSQIPVTVSDTLIQSDIFCDLSHTVQKKKIEKQIAVAIQPNPATAFVIVKTPVDLPFDVYDISGKLKIRSTTNHSTNISALKPGVYIINIIIKNEVIRKILVKK